MSNITAKVIAKSVSSLDPDRKIITFELEYPRFIHGELMTHRMFSRNAASSRAIPIETMVESVLDNPAVPVQWGLNQSGMQAKEEHTNPKECITKWGYASEDAVDSANYLRTLGLHKQIVNRVLEPFQMMKTIVTATELDNFYWLRCHADAQPEIRVLAEKMYEADKAKTAQVLQPGQWHLPYVVTYVCPEYGNEMYNLDDEDQTELTLEEAKKISASCCAQVSYRKNDDSLEKALKIWDMLVNMTPVHASPFEHQATPMEQIQCISTFGGIWEEGKTHQDREGCFWSGNFKGWIQHRQLIDNHVCTNYK